MACVWDSSDSRAAVRARCSSSSPGTASDPGKVHSGQVGVAVLKDPRLDFLASLHSPKKVTPATVEFLDTPGLIPGTHGDNPQRLAVIREGDALLIVLNGFAGGDPATELKAFHEEMLFADLGVVTNRVERLEASVKKHRPDWEQQEKELSIVKRIQATLEDGKFVSTLGLSAEAKKPLRSFGLLTDKPEVIVLNAVHGQEVPDKLRGLAPDVLALDAKLELELVQLEPDEREAFMTDLGVGELGRAGSSAPRTTPSASSPSSRPGSPRSAAGTWRRAERRRGRRQDPHRPGQGFRPGRGHRVRRPARRGHGQGSQGQAHGAARRERLRRQGRRHHLFPQCALTCGRRCSGTVQERTPHSPGAA